MIAMACTSEGDGDAEQPPTTVPGDVEVSAPDGYTVHRGEDFGFAFPFEWSTVPGGGTYADGAVLEIVGPSGDLGLPPIISVYREEGFVGDFDRYLFTFNGESATALPDRTIIRDEPTSVPHSVEARLIEAEYSLQDVAGLVVEQDEAGKPERSDKGRRADNERNKKGDEKRGSGTSRGDKDARNKGADEDARKDRDEPQEPASVSIRQVDVLVLTPEGVTINLRAAAPSEEFDKFSEVFTTVIASLRVPAPVVGDDA